jgi:hypothetical protein
MKKIFCLLALLQLFVGCNTQYVQVFNTNSINSKEVDGYWVYDNDSVKVTYQFWKEYGLMSFSVYNKLNKPIYIDWKSSSFIVNGNKYNYWVDEQQTSAVSLYGGYFYQGPLVAPGFTANAGLQETVATSMKPEKITFIPPQSKYNRSQFYLFPFQYFKLDTSVATGVTIPRNDNPKARTRIYIGKYNKSNTPLNFRNYLSYSFSENSTEFFHADNEFYVDQITEMDMRHFAYLRKNEQGIKSQIVPYKKYSSFYLLLERRHVGNKYRNQ